MADNVTLTTGLGAALPKSESRAVEEVHGYKLRRVDGSLYMSGIMLKRTIVFGGTVQAVVGMLLVVLWFRLGDMQLQQARLEDELRSSRELIGGLRGELEVKREWDNREASDARLRAQDLGHRLDSEAQDQSAKLGDMGTRVERSQEALRSLQGQIRAVRPPPSPTATAATENTRRAGFELRAGQRWTDAGAGLSVSYDNASDSHVRGLRMTTSTGVLIGSAADLEVGRALEATGEHGHVMLIPTAIQKSFLRPAYVTFELQVTEVAK